LEAFSNQRITSFIAMFNPFKVQLNCNHSIPSDEREKFLEFVNSQLLIIGCDRAWRESSQVKFSNGLFSFSRGRHHVMAGVDGGTIAFSPFSNQITYEYQSTRLGIIMTCFALFGLLIFMLNTAAPDFFSFFFLFFLAIIILINWAVIRYRQQKFLQQLEQEYKRMRNVFSPSR